MVGRRSFLLGCLYTIGAGVLAKKLFKLQVTDHQKFQAMATNNRVRTSATQPIRGKIKDRQGNILASNQEVFELIFDARLPHSTQDIHFIIASLGKFLPLSDAEIRKIMSARGVIAIREIDWEELEKLELYLPSLPALYVGILYRRLYPYRESLANILGYMQQSRQGERGVAGIEKTCDLELHGDAGAISQEVNARGNIVGVISQKSPAAGQDIKLSIDLAAQQLIQKLLPDTGGAAVVIEIKTGNIFSLNSSPSYDNNLFIRGMTSQQWRSLNNNSHHPMTNRAISFRTALGSTFKLPCCLAALENGILDEDDLINCSGSVSAGDRIFRCARSWGHGPVNMRQAIAGSCNSYFYNLAKIINIDLIIEAALELGLGENTFGVLDGEVAGFLPHSAWRSKEVAWGLGDNMNFVIGQGYTLGTPLQLAVMTARIASGKKVQPTIVQRGAAQEFGLLSFSSKVLDYVRSGMRQVLSSSLGTARRHNPSLYTMAGKTGTAQTSSNETEKNNSLFVAYAPYNNPKYALSVLIEKHPSINNYAPEVARKIFDTLYDLGYLKS